MNAIWFGSVAQPVVLPQLGHIFLLFPLGETAVSCAGSIIDGKHYMFLMDVEEERPFTLEKAHPNKIDSQLLLLMLSPGFIAGMAAFLNIPVELRHLLNAIPLLQGDSFSRVLQYLAAMNNTKQNHAETEEMFMEVVGQVLYLMKLRHQTLLRLSAHKQNTISDLLPRLFQARQFIEARHLEAIKTVDVANHIALSEYHFARLFKTTFEVTVHQFVLRLRLDEARRLLERSELSVTDIAFTVGYNSLSAFINAFHRRFDMPPSTYRAQFDI